MGGESDGGDEGVEPATPASGAGEGDAKGARAAAAAMLDLRSPPGNRLEASKGQLKGFHSIRVNDQWRLVFRWEGNDAHKVRLVDHHS